MPGPGDGSYVYALFREDGTPFYIGKGKGKRWIQHLSRARRGHAGHRFNIIRSMLARGFDVPIVKIHQGLSDQVANEYEIALIAAVGRGSNGPLVNLTEGGEGRTGPRRPLSSDERTKISASLQGRKAAPETVAKIGAALRGKTHSPQARANMSAGQRGRKHTPEQRLNNSLRQLGKKMLPESVAKTAAANRGRKRSPETLAKLSAASSGRRHSPEARAKISAAKLGRKMSPEHHAKLLAGQARGRARK